MTSWVRRNNHPFILTGVSCALAVVLFELLAGSIFAVPDLREDVARMQGQGNEKALRAAREAMSAKMEKRIRPALAQYLAKASFSSHLTDFPSDVNFGNILVERVGQVSEHAHAYARAKGMTLEGVLSLRSEGTLTAIRLRRHFTALAAADRVIRLAADRGVKRLRIRNMQAGGSKRNMAPPRIEIEIRGHEQQVWKFLGALATPGIFLMIDSLSIEIDRNNPEILRVRNIVLGPADTATKPRKR